MSLRTIEVELDHGRVIARGGEMLPDRSPALLTLLPSEPAAANPLVRNPALGGIVFAEDPTAPLEREDWPEALS